MPTSSRGGGGELEGGSGGDGGAVAVSDEVATESPKFEHFAELFAQAKPKSDADKALGAAYWVQVYEGKSEWQSRLLSTELKHLGHSVSNVTKSLTANMNKRPQLVIQLRKSGSAKQANKTYKVTSEGPCTSGAC